MTSHSEFARAAAQGRAQDISAPVAVDALNNRWTAVDAADFNSDLDVLNYALTLEYLEATFYQEGNAKVSLSGKAKTYLSKIQADEEFHVTALTQTIQKLGGTPVAKPSVDFGGAFASANSFLTTSHTFENVGVGAYLGAAGFIKDKSVLQAAAGIFGVEARHAAIVGNLLGLTPEGGVYMGATETPKSKASVLAMVTPFLSQMGKMPSGGVQTGGGGTAGVEDKKWFTAGGVALVGAAGAAAYAATRRPAAEGSDSDS